MEGLEQFLDGEDVDATEVVVQRLDGFPARLRRLEDGSLVIEAPDGGALPTLGSGERLRVTQSVVGDATYGLRARVLQVEDDGAHIRRGGAPERDQQRRHVRVRTRPIEVVFIGDEGADASGQLSDLSAGGVRTSIAAGEVEVGQHQRLTFDLPGVGGGASERVALDGEVVWVGSTGDGRPAAGVQFVDLDEKTEARLAAWVFREEATRLTTRD